LSGPAAELLAKEKEVSRVRGYPDPYTGKEFRVEMPGFQRTDRAFVLAGTAAEVCLETTTLLEGETKTSGGLSFYDARQNRTSHYEYDFGSAPAPETTTVTGYTAWSCPVAAPSAYARRTATGFSNDTDYTQQPSHLPSLVVSHEVFEKTAGGETSVTKTIFTNDGPARNGISGLNQWTNFGGSKFGNLTNVTRTVKDLYTDGTFTETDATISENRTFDVAGNINTVTDPAGGVFTYDYTNSCGGTAPAGTLGAYLKFVTFPTVNGSAMSQSWQYDCYAGRPLNFTDKNGTVTGFVYETAADKLNRLKTVTRGNGGKTAFSYVDTAGAVSVTTETDQFAVDDKKHLEKVEYDGLGRGFRVSAGAGAALIQTETSIDGLGRKYRSYLPYGNGESATKYQEIEYDAAGRVKKVTHQPGGAVVNTIYSLETSTVTDEAGKKVAGSVDGLGRMVKVVEDPGGLGYVTDYTYNGQDKLRTAVQKGSGGSAIVSRTFDYDTLGRLLKGVNPERGTTRYRYDGNGNVLSRREDDGTTISNSYDGWNRLTGRSYTGALTKPGKWCYDGQAYTAATYTSAGVLQTPAVCTGTVLANSRGLLTGAGSDDSAVGYGYDAFGRVVSSSQTTPGMGGSVYPFTYSYYLDDSMETERYPSMWGHRRRSASAMTRMGG
jgi:YD repeat-containing protein